MKSGVEEVEEPIVKPPPRPRPRPCRILWCAFPLLIKPLAPPESALSARWRVVEFNDGRMAGPRDDSSARPPVKPIPACSAARCIYVLVVFASSVDGVVPFTAGNVVVLSPQNLASSNAAASINLIEYTPSGTTVQTISVPGACTLSPAATTEGKLASSYDGTRVSWGCFICAANTAAIATVRHETRHTTLQSGSNTPPSPSPARRLRRPAPGLPRTSTQRAPSAQLRPSGRLHTTAKMCAQPSRLTRPGIMSWQALP